MKYLPVLLLALVLPLTSWGSSLEKRYAKAITSCLNPKQSSLQVVYDKAPADMVDHYRPSYAQRASFHLYRGIFDKFGGVVQGMISGGDEAYVKPYLNGLGRELRNKRISERLSEKQSICLASCMINQLMKADMEVAPTASMELAVARGRGFCRHFVLAMDQVLKGAGIKSKFGYSWTHIFFYFQNQGKKVIFDPGVSDGINSCEFYDEVKR